MKIAVTADVHLRTGGEHPERYVALENILEQTRDIGIKHLIIAGDLFDKELQNYSEFETLCTKYDDLDLYIIPGNHDPNIADKDIVGANIHIYTEPTVLEVDSTILLFIPYVAGKAMGEEIARAKDKIEGSEKEWVLIGHGEVYGGGGIREVNHLEPGPHMPLTRRAVEEFKPRLALLGHIHKPHEPIPDVHFVGSPCGLDITETGHRQFVVYDTDSGSIEALAVRGEQLYFNESFLIFPAVDEISLLEKEITERIESWNVDPPDHSKIQVRLSASGYSKNRSAVKDALKLGFEGFMAYEDEDPNIEELYSTTDEQLEDVRSRTMELIEECDWDWGVGSEPTRDQVKIAALAAIYGKVS